MPEPQYQVQSGLPQAEQPQQYTQNPHNNTQSNYGANPTYYSTTMNRNEDRTSWFRDKLLAPIIVAVVIGVCSSVITSGRMVASFQQQQAVENAVTTSKIDQNTKDIAAIKAVMVPRAEHEVKDKMLTDSLEGIRTIQVSQADDLKELRRLVEQIAFSPNITVKHK